MKPAPARRVSRAEVRSEDETTSGPWLAARCRVALRTYQIARPEARLGSPAKVAEPADAPALEAVPITRFFSLTCQDLADLLAVTANPLKVDSLS